MRSTVRQVLAAALVAGVAAPCIAQFRKPDDAIRYRQSVMFTMGTHFYSRIGAMVNGRIPFDAKAAVEHADLIVVLSRLPWVAFGPGTDQGITDAKPAIWTDTAKFKDLSEKMQAEVLKLQAAARTGDPEALRVAYRATGAACKACHDQFTTQ